MTLLADTLSPNAQKMVDLSREEFEPNIKDQH